MNISEAFEILNVKNNSSIKEVKESYKKLSKKFHPDINKDNNSKNYQIRLNEAYEIIKSYITLNGTIIQQNNDIRLYKGINAFQKSEERRRTSQLEIENFLTRKIVPYRIFQTISWVIAALILIITFIKRTSLVSETYELSETYGLSKYFFDQIPKYLNISIIIFGYIGLMFQVIVMIVNNKVKRINYQLSNKKECFKNLSYYLKDNFHSSFSKAKLSQLIINKQLIGIDYIIEKFKISSKQRDLSVKKVLLHRLKLIDNSCLSWLTKHVDFSELLISNSKGHGLIEEIVDLNKIEDYRISDEIMNNADEVGTYSIERTELVKLYFYLPKIYLYFVLPLFLLYFTFEITFLHGYFLGLLLIPILGFLYVLIKIVKLIVMD